MGRFFKIAIFGHETWPLVKMPDVAHIPVLSFYPKRSKLSLVLLYGQRFPRYGPIFRIAIFGHILPKQPPSPKFHSVLLHGWPFPRYWQCCIFPLATMLNFNLFSKGSNLKFQNLKKQVLCGLLQGTLRKSLVEEESKL